MGFWLASSGTKRKLPPGLGLLAVGEKAGGLHKDINTQVAPGQVGGVTLREHLDVLAVDGDAILVVGDLAVEPTEDRVVLEQVGQGWRPR